MPPNLPPVPSPNDARGAGAPPAGAPPAPPDPARLSREVFALAARCDAGFTDLAERLDGVQEALGALAARADEADRRHAALEHAAAADRLALAAVLDPLDDLLALVRAGSGRPDAPAQASPALLAVLEPLAASQQAALARAGIEEIPAAPGAPFDPRLHDGVGTRPGAASAPGTVAEVVRRGFRWQGTVLRRAQVVIAE